MVRKLAVRSLRRGIGSMDYIETLLIMEDDLDNESDTLENMQTGILMICKAAASLRHRAWNHHRIILHHAKLHEWCRCEKCRPMPQQVENKCCGLKKCITMIARFDNDCMFLIPMCWPELCIRNAGDIRNDREAIVQGPSGNLHTDNLHLHAMVIWERAIDEYALPV
ncbi:P2X purinoceptor 7-like [Paramuricea clavata]|uniref:P2X purinoceptor 7-like n=1 Tax=Paramuricea clavata TaxID=317549 RepID=A0A6S7HI78_PARCT|nr:P2X purinoceptor 7-like [Paramuricea clavata]